MNEKEISEIRRRLKPDKNAISHIVGCYVNENHEIIAVFDQSLGLMPESEAEKYLNILKRTLSGTLGKNLMDISFATKQVAEGQEHKALMELRSSELKDEAAIRAFCEKIIPAVALESNYLIVLARDSYDVPYRARDDAELDTPAEVFSYIVCSICPVKQTKPGLSWFSDDGSFHNQEADWVVSSPELGFMFPAFNNRSTDIYSALYYTRDTADVHGEFIDAVFKTEAPMAAAVQKETFQSVLSESLSEDCRYEVVQAVRQQLCGKIEEYKASKEPEPPVVSKGEVKSILQSCGVKQEKVAAFDEKFEEEFGGDVDLGAKNLVDTGTFEIKTPDVVIKVNPDRTDLIATRMIGGSRYILICADEGVEVNGVNIAIAEE